MVNDMFLERVCKRLAWLNWCGASVEMTTTAGRVGCAHLLSERSESMAKLQQFKTFKYPRIYNIKYGAKQVGWATPTFFSFCKFKKFLLCFTAGALISGGSISQKANAEFVFGTTTIVGPRINSSKYDYGVSLSANGSVAQFQVPNHSIRILSWNIEFLGAREPPRTQEQHDALAQRILTFNASVLALQEITVKEVLEYIRGKLGVSWRIYHSGDSENALLYDGNKVEMLSTEILRTLKKPPYTQYPGAGHRFPVSGVFRPIGRLAEPFRVIGVHCHWNDVNIRTSEGIWLRNKIEEFLYDPVEPKDIILMGDLNGLLGNPPHLSLQEGNILHLLPKDGAPIDHFYVTQGARDKILKQRAFVILPEHYGETPAQFRETYSDHYPIFIDFKPESRTDFINFAIFAIYWLETGCNVHNKWCNRADLDGDGDVNMTDLSIFAEHWLHEIGLIAHWKLDEQRGDIAHDRISKYNGILHGSPMWRADKGKVNGALLFDGRDDYIETPFVWNPASGPFSVFAWVFGGNPGQVVIAQTGYTSLDGRIWLGLDSLERKLITTLTKGARFEWPLVSESTMSDDEWHHVGLVWDGLRHLYMNGAEVAKDAGDINRLESSDGGLYFGAGKNLSAESFWNGLIDDVRIYNKALDARDIRHLALAVDGGKVEGFETGNFDKFDWRHYGNANWVISTLAKNSGTYSARSGLIFDDESSSLEIMLDCVDGEISFYRKVSSESGFDYLKFYIDRIEKSRWSGDRDWAKVFYSVTEGTHTFTWTYSKDSTVSSGYDSAWIDDVEFPVP